MRTDGKVALGLVALAAAVVAVPSSAVSDGVAGREATLQRELDRVIAAGVPGSVLLVADRGRTTRLTSGDATLNPRTPTHVGDRFRVGSITKTFVAAVVLQLVGQRKLHLEDSVNRCCPGSYRTVRAPVNGFQFFHLPKPAADAVDRLIETAYCH